MIYILYFKRDKIFEDQIGPEEIKHYTQLPAFIPLLEKRGKVVLVEDPRAQVDGVHQLAKYVGSKSVFLFFSPPDKNYCEVLSPKIFLTSIDKKGKRLFSNSKPILKKYLLQEGVKQSLGGIVHNAQAINYLMEWMKKDASLTFIPPPLWDHYHHLYRNDIKQEQTNIHTKGQLLDTHLAGLRPECKTYAIPLKRRLQSVRAALRKKRRLLALEYLVQAKSKHYVSTQIKLSKLVYTLVVHPAHPFKNWKKLIRAFCGVFRKNEEATLVIKMAGRVSVQTKRRLLLFLKGQSCKARIIIIQEHLPIREYQQLIDATTYILNVSIVDPIGNSQLEFMSAGKPALSPFHEATSLIHSGNAFVYKQKGSKQALLKRSLLDSYNLYKKQPQEYLALSKAAKDTMEQYCSEKVVAPQLFALLDMVEKQLA